MMISSIRRSGKVAQLEIRKPLEKLREIGFDLQIYSYRLQSDLYSTKKSRTARFRQRGVHIGPALRGSANAHQTASTDR
jgi:hypothetical protein